MKDNSIDDQLYAQIQREINRIENKVRMYNTAFYGIRFVQIGLAGLITVISGWHSSAGSDTNTILSLGAIITSITALDTLLQVESTRNTYKLVLFELKSIRTEIVFHYIQAKPTNGVKQLDDKIQQQLFEKYRKANLYSRDLIGSDIDKSTPKETVPAV